MIFIKTLKTVLIAVIFSFGASSVIFAKNSASINAFGLQVSLGIANSSWGGTLYFTTYDASGTYPLNNNGIVSGELKPIEKGSSVFVTDYLAGDSFGIYEYGTVSLSFPETDSDNNGVPDWLQKNMSVNMNVTGSSEIHYLATGYSSGNASLNGTFLRSAGLSTGSYNITFNIPSLGNGTVSGSWYVSYYNGTIEYDDTLFHINAETINAEGQIVKANGTSEYTVNPDGKLNLAGINLDVDGDTVQMQSMLFERSNSSYSVLATAIDGLPETSWADFSQWYIEIIDSNDGDNDGNPDFSDLDRIISSNSTLSADGWGWIKWPWAYSDFYKSWIYFYPSGVGQISVFHVSDQRWYRWNASSQSWLSVD